MLQLSHEKYDSVRVMDVDIPVESRIRVLLASLVVLTLIGCPVLAADSIQQLLLQTTTVDNNLQPATRGVETIQQISSLGITSILLSAIPSRALYEQLGPRLTSLLGSTLHALGFCLLSITTDELYTKYCAVMMLGLSAACIMYSHSCVPNAFPGNANVIIVAMGAAIGLSVLGPWLLTLSHYTSSASSVTSYILLTGGLSAFLDILHLPWRQIKQSRPVCTMLDGLLAEQNSRLSFELQNFEPAGQQLQSSVVYKDMKCDGHKRAVLLIGIFFTLSFLRLKVFLISFRATVQEMGQCGTLFHMYADCFNYVFLFISMFGPFWVEILDKKGPFVFMLLSNLTGCLPFIFLLFNQYVAATLAGLFFILHAASVPGQVLSLLTTITGFADIDETTTRVILVTSVISLLVDACWPHFVLHVLNSFQLGGAIIIAVSATNFLIPGLFLQSHTLFDIPESKDRLARAERRSLTRYACVVPLVFMCDSSLILTLRKTRRLEGKNIN